jgi:signal transduction histidine kinase
MSKKHLALYCVTAIAFITLIVQGFLFLQPIENTIAQTLKQEIQDSESINRAQFIFADNELVYFDHNAFIPDIAYCASSDTLIQNQPSLYYIKSFKKADTTYVTTLNLTDIFSQNNASNYTASISPCTDCISLQLANNILFIGKKGTLNVPLYFSLFAFSILFLFCLFFSKQIAIQNLGIIILPPIIALLWVLSPLLPPHISTQFLFQYYPLGIGNLSQFVLALLLIFFITKALYLHLAPSKIAYIRSVYVVILGLFLSIFLTESSSQLVSLTQELSLYYFIGICLISAHLIYHAVRLRWKSRNQLITLALALSGGYFLTPTVLILLPIILLALLLRYNRKKTYLILAIFFSVAISLITEIKFNENYKLKQAAFVNNLVDRENILQAYHFPEIIKEANLLQGIYDLDFESLFATAFQNEYLGYYNYSITNNDSAIINKKYTPYGLGYFTVFEQNKPALQPESYAFYIDNELVEEQPLGQFQKRLPKTALINYSQFGIEEYTVLLPLQTIDYIKLLSRATFIFLLLYAFSYIYHSSWRTKSIRNNISSAILLFSLGILGIWAGISYHYLTQSETKNIENNILEKTQSLQIELEHKISKTPGVMGNSDFLNPLLRKFSTVFFTDINIYKTDGRLLASSRPQVYQAGLLSERINPSALTHFAKNSRPMVTHEELNDIKFISAYAPVHLDGNDFYIHLPFFNRNDELNNRIENLTEVFINLLLLVFLLATTLSVFLSYSISQPLLRLSNNIRSLSIQGKNTTASVPPERELQALSMAYNQKVKELEDSVEKLTESEREKTWRSMARQVAHEIKNPLTPIKLNAQFFQRQLEDDRLNPEKFKKFLDSLQEQVNNLTRVANDFGDLASFNNPKPEKLNVTEIIHNLPSYQAYQSQIRIEGFANISADKSHLTRIFNNLISNAVEACENDQEFEIDILILSKESSIEILFHDNGPGIALENREKIFLPNFSTKKTGMGLGLYMISTLVKQNNGTIILEDSAYGACFKLCFLATEN